VASRFPVCRALLLRGECALNVSRRDPPRLAVPDGRQSEMRSYRFVPHQFAGDPGDLWTALVISSLFFAVLMTVLLPSLITARVCRLANVQCEIHFCRNFAFPFVVGCFCDFSIAPQLLFSGDILVRCDAWARFFEAPISRNVAVIISCLVLFFSDPCFSLILLYSKSLAIPVISSRCSFSVVCSCSL